MEHDKGHVKALAEVVVRFTMKVDGAWRINDSIRDLHAGIQRLAELSIMPDQNIDNIMVNIDSIVIKDPAGWI